MKKIIVIAVLFCSFSALAQKTTPGNYTYIAQKYEWDAGIFKALGIPSGPGPAAFTTGQVVRAGAIYYDTLGVDAGPKIWNGLAWVDFGGGSQTLQQVFNTEIGGSVLTKNDTILNDYTLRMIGNSAVAFGDLFSIVNSSTTGRALNLQSAGTNATIQAVNTKTSSGGGWAFYGQSVGSVPTANFLRDSSSNNTVIPVLSLTRRTTGTADDGIGGALTFYTETGGSDFISNEIVSKWAEADQTIRRSELDFNGLDSGVTEVFMNIQKDLVRINNNADTLATLADVRAGGGGGVGNLLVDSIGIAGTDLVIPRNDTLYHRLLKGTTHIGIDTVVSTGEARVTLLSIPVSYVIAASDETTDITTGTAKVTFRMPYAMTVTDVRASVNTVSSSGLPTIDINDGGTTILSTKITIDVSEKSSTTAATPPVISDSALADDAEITIDIDVAGTGAKGLKIIITGTRTI